MSLFKRSISFTDLHLGLKNNSKTHNEDCIQYIEWFISQAKLKNAETCFFLGDFMHHRNHVNSQTLEYGIKVMQMLNDNFEQVFFIVGNHDLYYRESRAITSARYASLFPNITLVDEILTKDNVTIVPWLVEEEWKNISNIKSKYMFGHFEIPGFKMNAQIEMPDHGTINHSHFKNQDYVFSGHFHKRQSNRNIHYIGNAFGHNYSDSWDFERGAMFLEWGSTPEYLNCETTPKYITCYLSDILNNTDELLKPKTHARVTLDVAISYEEANFLRETFMENYDIRELKLIHETKNEMNVDDVEITFQTIDEIVSEQLQTIDSNSFDIQKLLSIYNGLN